MADICFGWPKGLSLFDLKRVVWGRWQQRMPEVLADLSAKGVTLTLDDAYGIAEAIKGASDEAGFFILDEDRNPEPFCPPELPTCVLETQDNEYIDPNKMEGILALYNGKPLPPDLSDDQRRTQLKMLRRRLVAARSCKTAGCTNRIKVTVAMAAKAIIGHGLLKKGLPYELPTLCRSCRNNRDQQLSERRGSGGGGSRPVSNLHTTLTGDKPSPTPTGMIEPDSVPTDYSVDKMPATVGDVHNNEEALKEVKPNGDHAVPAAAPVEEQTQ